MSRLAYWATGLVALVTATAVQAQFYPSRPINMIVPFAPGGSADANARPLAEYLSKALKQPVLVQNRGGAGGANGTAAAIAAKPDGYTVLLTLSTISAIPESEKLQGRKPTYELSQLTPVGMISAEPVVLIVRSDAPWNTLKEFTDDARAHPERISYGSSGTYGPTHLATEMYANAAGISLQHIPYTGAGPALGALLGGHVDASVAAMATALPQLRAGKVKALASWGSKRLPSLAAVPTFREFGYDIEFTNWAGLFVPAGTPAEVVDTLRAAMQETAKTPEFVALMEKMGIPVTYMDAPQFKAHWADDAKRLTKVVQRIGVVN